MHSTRTAYLVLFVIYNIESALNKLLYIGLSTTQATILPN